MERYDKLVDTKTEKKVKNRLLYLQNDAKNLYEMTGVLLKAIDNEEKRCIMRITLIQ